MRDTRHGPVAQLAEQQTLNLLVLGSTPSGLTKNPTEITAFRRYSRPTHPFHTPRHTHTGQNTRSSGLAGLDGQRVRIAFIC